MMVKSEMSRSSTKELKKLKNKSKRLKSYNVFAQKDRPYHYLSGWPDIEAIVELKEKCNKDKRSKILTLKKNAHKLAQIRNSILLTLKEINEFDETEDLSLLIGKEHFVSIADATRKALEEGSLDWFQLWNIKKKVQDNKIYDEKEIYDESQLSDD